MEREEAISVLKELLDNCRGLDGHGLELTSPNSPASGYQIIIRGILDEETKECAQEILLNRQLKCQAGSFWKTKHSPNKTEPDTLIIYRK